MALNRNPLFAAILILLSVFILFSCQDTGLLSSDAGDVEILTLSNGSILNSNGEIPVSLSPLGDGDYLLDMVLTDGQGNRLGEVHLEAEELEDIPPVTLPENLPEGYYLLNLTVTSDGETVRQKELSFFIREEQPRMNGLVSYPLVFHPGGEGLVIMDAYIPRGQDPWIRWRFQGRILAEGLYSRGLDRVLVQGPQSPGIFSLRAELFPQAPPAGQYWDFDSPVFVESPVYVSAQPEPGPNDLDYPGSYYSLFHFQGEITDLGERPVPLVLTPVGQPSLDVSRGIFGYRMEPGSGFSGDQLLVPVSDRGELEPFSLVLVFSLPGSAENRTILETVSRDGGFRLSLSTNADGIPSLEIRTGSSVLSLSPGEAWAGGEFNPLILSVFPDYKNRKISLLWYQEGSLVTGTPADWNPGPLDPRGTTRLGGDGGGAEILDELGVYWRDVSGRASPAPDIFAAFSRERYGNRLLYADGFDSLELRPELESLFPFNRGRWDLLFSRLGIHSGGLFHFPGFRADEGDFSGILTVSPDSGSRIFLQVRRVAGGVSELVGEIPAVPGENEIRIAFGSGGNLSLNGQEFAYEAGTSGEEDTFHLSLENRGAGMLFVREILLLKEMLRLADGEFDGPEAAESGEPEILPGEPRA